MIVQRELTKAITEPLTKSIDAWLGGGSAAFDPASLFVGGYQGVFYDNNDLSSFYLDSTGTTPATVNGLVGLQLDKSQGLVLGADRAINGDMESGSLPTIDWTGATGTAGWNTTDPISGSRDFLIDITSASISRPSVSFNVAGSVEVGKTYRMEFDYKVVSGAPTTSLIYIGGAAVSIPTRVFSGAGKFVATYRATGTIGSCGLYFTTSAGAMQIDNVSYKELPGNHRYQTTTGSKPVLRGTPVGSSLVSNGDFASGADWTAGSGWAIGSGVATATTSSGTLTSTLTATSGRVYRVTYTATRSAGSVRPSFGGVSLTSRSASGTYVEYMTASSTAALVFTGTTFSGTVDNVEVVDVSADAVQAPYGLQYDGVDDFMSIAGVDFTATDKIFSCVGVQSFTASSQMVAELSATSTTNNGSFSLFHLGGTGTDAYLRGDSAQAGRRTVNASLPALFIQSCSFDIAGVSVTDEILPRIDGVSGSISTVAAGPAGSGNFGNYALYFGRRAGASLPLNGLDFGIVIVGKTVSTTERDSTEQYIASRTGVTL